MILEFVFFYKVESILNESRIWREFKDQDHGLFIQKTNQILAIGGSVPGVAGNYQLLFFYFLSFFMKRTEMIHVFQIHFSIFVLT